MKRAAIYIRTSTEKQGEKVSPQAQEADSTEYCTGKGYQVVGVYKDIERYKVGNRLVEPSGTRADRPQLKRILADASAGKFEVIVAWREDRLYRSYRPMLDVLECLDETGIDIELVKENFNKDFAPIKAWAARMELDAKHDRFMMGVAGRLSKGMAWNHPAPYGYKKDEEGFYTVNEEEADWIINLFKWYADGISINEIRQRFVNGCAPQRKDTVYTWSMSLLRRYLTFKHFWTGEHIVNWDGEAYKIPLPPIIPLELAERVQNRK